MGYVICETHGGQGGVLCCDHVANAAYGKGPTISYNVLKVDIDGHKDDEILHNICGDCLSRFNLTNIEYVPEEIWASEDKFPYVYPVCGLCFDQISKT